VVESKLSDWSCQGSVNGQKTFGGKAILSNHLQLNFVYTSYHKSA
jgi:hypothetical protein